MNRKLLFCIITLIFFSGCDYIDKQLEDVWAAIDNMTLIPGPQGEQGPPGPAGDCEVTDAELDQLIDRVSALESIVGANEQDCGCILPWASMDSNMLFYTNSSCSGTPLDDGVEIAKGTLVYFGDPGETYCNIYARMDENDCYLFRDFDPQWSCN